LASTAGNVSQETIQQYNKYSKGEVSSMIRTHVEPCRLAKKTADELNRASGAIYTQVLVFHWRTYRHTGHWLSSPAAERWNDRVGRETNLHAHSIDAAQ
jgi:hypothetical protein